MTSLPCPTPATGECRDCLPNGNQPCEECAAINATIDNVLGGDPVTVGERLVAREDDNLRFLQLQAQIQVENQRFVTLSQAMAERKAKDGVR